MSGPRELLGRLAAGNDDSLRAILTPIPGRSRAQPLCERFLGRHTESLVRLGALFAVNAPPASLRWAVDLAAAAGVDDEEVVATLIAVAFIAGSAQAVCTSPSLALALGFDVEEEDASSAR